MAFQFPANPAPYATVLNDITGSTYQWRPDLTKWVITTKKATSTDLIWEGDNPPDPIGDYKLWYSTDTLELYFHYCDANGVCAWVPTSAPITMLEDLDNTVFELRRDLNATNVAVGENENRIGRTIEYSDTAPTIYPEEEYDGEFFFNELNFKFWYDTSRLELLVLIKDADGDYSYVPVSIPLTDIDLDALNTQVQANSYSNNQQEQAIQALEMLIFDRVAKHGGDEMEGPLTIQNQPGMGSRDARRINTLGVFSNSDNSALRLGTTRDRVYIGHDDTSFNGPIKVDELQEKNANNGVKVANDLKLGMNQIKNLGAAAEDNDAVPYGQVKDELKDLKDQIIQDAAVGVFKWDTQSSNTAPVSGCFFGKNNASNATEPFINNFRVSNQDINGANQDLSTWDVGDIITWTNSTNSAYQIRYRVQTVPTFQNGHYFFEVQYISQTNLFVQGQDFILTRQQFTNIDFGDLETTYLRLDGDNGPMQGDVNFGRHSVTNMLAIDLVANGSYIKAAGNNMLRVYSGSLTSEGYAQVRVERPSKATRGFAIRGYEEGSDSMRDLLYSYHPDSPTGDVIIYRGRTSSDQAIQTKESVQALIAEELANQAPNSGRVIITPLEFYMNSYGQYPNESSITGLTSGGNPTGGNDVYGYHIPWKWFEQNHPELIGYIYTAEGNMINGRAASVSERNVSGNPGLSIIDSSNRTNRATVTITGWHVQVDDISEEQYTHKF